MLCALVASCATGASTGCESNEGLAEGAVSGFLPDGHGGVMETTFVVDGDDVIYQGDILFSRDEVEELNFAYSETDVQTSFVQSRDNMKWPGGIVPYELSKDLKAKKAVMAAIKYWEAKTPVRFVARTNEVYGLRFENSDRKNVSTAYYGFNGKVREVRIWEGHGADTVMHELGHAVAAMMHTHTRFDRDKYVKIIWDNIKEDDKSNFKLRSGGLAPFAVYISSTRPDYDLYSIMNYHPYAFAKDKTKKTIKYLGSEPKGVGSETKLSEGDIALITDMYTDKLLAIWGNVSAVQVAEYCHNSMAEVVAGNSTCEQALRSPDGGVSEVEESQYATCSQIFISCVQLTNLNVCNKSDCGLLAASSEGAL